MITLATLILLITYTVVIQHFKTDIAEAKEDTEKLILLIEFRRLLSNSEQTESNIKFITLEKEEKKDMKLNIQLFAKKNIALEKLKEAVERKGLKKITEEITILSAEEIAKKHEQELNNELLDYLTDLMHVENSKQIYLERLTVENYLLKQNKEVVKEVKRKLSRAIEKVPTEKDDLLLQNKIHFEKDIKHEYTYPSIEITGKDFDNLVESFKFSTTEKDNWSCGKVEIFKGKITSTDTYALIQYNIGSYSEEKFYITTDVFKKISSDLKKFSNKKVTIYKVNEEDFIISWNNRTVKYRLLTTHFVNYPMLIESINNYGEELEFSPELKDKIDLIKIENKKYKENTVILDTENKIVRGSDDKKEYKIDYIATKQIKVGMNQDYLSYALGLTNKCNYKNNSSMFIFKKDNITFLFAPKALKD